MPNPKRRHSTRRTALRRSHDFLTATGLSECPNCHEKKLPIAPAPSAVSTRDAPFWTLKKQPSK